MQMAWMFLAAMVMAQAPAAAQPTPQSPVLKKHKPPQVCEDIDITGSRLQRHICHDANVNADALLGISNSLDGKAKLGAHAGDRGDSNTMPGG
jgi:hypothetical protein